MALVDYSDTDADADANAAPPLSPTAAALPSRFHELYAVPPRLSKDNDPTLQIVAYV